jgi:formylglycine-generating enzyme required for sulfatase activity
MKDRSESGYDFYFEQPSLKLLPIQANFEREKEITGCAPVGIGKANNLGLYDMHGNMWELCNDRSGKIKRIVRGGGWDCPAKLCRAAGYFPDGKQFATEHYFKWSSLGFRVARVPADLENK